MKMIAVINHETRTIRLGAAETLRAEAQDSRPRMTPNAHERNEWRRLAANATARGFRRRSSFDLKKVCGFGARIFGSGLL